MSITNKNLHEKIYQSMKNWEDKKKVIEKEEHEEENIILPSDYSYESIEKELPDDKEEDEESEIFYLEKEELRMEYENEKSNTHLLCVYRINRDLSKPFLQFALESNNGVYEFPRFDVPVVEESVHPVVVPPAEPVVTPSPEVAAEPVPIEPVPVPVEPVVTPSPEVAEEPVPVEPVVVQPVEQVVIEPVPVPVEPVVTPSPEVAEETVPVEPVPIESVPVEPVVVPPVEPVVVPPPQQPVNDKPIPQKGFFWGGDDDDNEIIEKTPFFLKADETFKSFMGESGYSDNTYKGFAEYKINDGAFIAAVFNDEIQVIDETSKQWATLDEIMNKKLLLGQQIDDSVYELFTQNRFLSTITYASNKNVPTPVTVYLCKYNDNGELENVYYKDGENNKTSLSLIDYSVDHETFGVIYIFSSKPINNDFSNIKRYSLFIDDSLYILNKDEDLLGFIPPIMEEEEEETEMRKKNYKDYECVRFYQGSDTFWAVKSARVFVEL